MKPQSAKAKGRNLQKWVVQQLIETFDMPKEKVPFYQEPIKRLI